MKLKCSVCKKNISKSYDSNPVNGDILGRPWYRDEKDLNHLAIVCLHCGTIHDCSGSFLSGIFSGFKSPVKIHNAISPMDLGMSILEHTEHPETESREIAIEGFGIPEEIINVLVKRKLLGRAFMDDTSNNEVTKDTTHHSKEPEQQDYVDQGWPDEHKTSLDNLYTALSYHGYLDDEKLTVDIKDIKKLIKETDICSRSRLIMFELIEQLPKSDGNKVSVSDYFRKLIFDYEEVKKFYHQNKKSTYHQQPLNPLMILTHIMI